MKRFQKYSLSILCIFSLMTLIGCIPLLIGAAVGAGGMTYVNGSLVHNVDESIEEVHEAALDALKDMNLFITSDELNKHSASIRAEYEDAKKIHISIEALTEYVTQIRIRIGTFGNQDEAQAILNVILKKL